MVMTVTAMQARRWAGWTLTEIAAAAGITKQRVHQILTTAPKLRRPDLVGMRFGRLIVCEAAGPRYWLCRCDCGAEVRTRAERLRSGRVKSCGCWRADATVRQTARLRVPERKRREIARSGAIALLAGRGMAQQEIARRLGVSQATVSRTLARIAEQH